MANRSLSKDTPELRSMRLHLRRCKIECKRINHFTLAVDHFRIALFFKEPGRVKILFRDFSFAIIDLYFSKPDAVLFKIDYYHSKFSVLSNQSRRQSSYF